MGEDEFVNDEPGYSAEKSKVHRGVSVRNRERSREER